MRAKILIIYHSKTGNTQEMAAAVEIGAKREGLEVIRKKIEDASVDDLLEPDGIIIGSPTYFANASGEVKSFIDGSIKHFGKLQGKVGAAFSSSGGLGGGGEMVILDILHTFLVHGMIIQGSTSVGHFGPISVGPPDQEGKKLCEALGTRVAELVKQLTKND